MTRVKVWLTVLAISLMANGLLVYLWLDRSMALADCNSSVSLTQTAAVQAKSLLLSAWRDRSQTEVTDMLRRSGAAADRKSEGEIQSGQLLFKFQNGVLNSID